jgi:hypothetical protein
VDAVLHGGRAASDEKGVKPTVGDKVVDFQSRRSGLLRLGLALAASITLYAGMQLWWPHGRKTVEFAALAPRVVEFFGTPPELPKRSQDKAELRAWLLAQGAPADFQIPAKLLALESFGCQVVDIRGRPAWLTCFWREKKPDATGGELVHLFAVRRSDFRDGPTSSAPQFRELNGWSFASWAEGDVIYTVAAAAPLEKLRPFVAVRRADAPLNS